MRRHIIGAIGIAGLATAMFYLITRGYENGLNNFFASMCLRLGIVMSAIWLGMPDLNRLFAKYPPWVFILGIIIVVAIVSNPKFFPFVMTLVGMVIAVQFVTRFLTPQKKKE